LISKKARFVNIFPFKNSPLAPTSYKLLSNGSNLLGEAAQKKPSAVGDKETVFVCGWKPSKYVE